MNAEDPFVRALTGGEGEQTITLIRRLRAPVADVWSALTAPDRIARWYGTIIGVCHARSATPSRSTSAAGWFGAPCSRAAMRRSRWRTPGGPAMTIPDSCSSGSRPKGTNSALRAARQAASPPDDPVRRGMGAEPRGPRRAPRHAAEPDVAPADRAAHWEQLREHPLQLEFAIDAPVSAVWDAWSSADALAAWWWNHWTDVTYLRRRAARRRVPDRRAGSRFRGLRRVPRRRTAAPAGVHVGVDGRGRGAP